MNSRILNIGVVLFMFFMSVKTDAQQTFFIGLNNEKIIKSPEQAGKDAAYIQVFLPSEEKRTGKAVLICPGGGYVFVATEHEGTKWAPFFNEMGIAVVVLKYRLPHGNDTIPLSDAEKALQIVAKHASEWKINPSDVGIMGFSAGGHLASTVATHTAKPLKPAFQILFYPVITMDKEQTHMGSHDNLLGKNVSAEKELFFSSEKQVTEETPPAILILAADDEAVLPYNGIRYFEAPAAKKVKAAIHIYPEGGHGWGFKPDFLYQDVILEELKVWLSSPDSKVEKP